MKIVEFLAQNENGFIKIPKKYCKDLKDKFKVVIVIDGKKIKMIKKEKADLGKIHVKKTKFVKKISEDKKMQSIFDETVKKYDTALKALADR